MTESKCVLFEKGAEHTERKAAKGKIAQHIEQSKEDAKKVRDG